MTDLHVRRLDDRGLTYVRDQLTDVNTLCAALLEVVLAAPGEVSTLVPSNTSKDRIYEFDLCGLLAANLDMSRAIALPEGGAMMEVESLHLERAQVVLDAMRRHPGSICLIDDTNPTWGDGIYVPEPTAFGVGQEVYHLADGAETDDEMADLLALGDAGWHGVSAVCRPPAPLTRADLSSADALARCARTVIQITFTAYRKEGFVVWTRGEDNTKQGTDILRDRKDD